jgi:manganese-dependent inorganic pyrophosphatase
MARAEKPLLVIGHKNPDTDSICSAITYARYKTEISREEAVARRAGNVNPQTQFVLSRFETESPPLAADVRPRIEDIMIPLEEVLTLRETDTLEKACELLTEHRFSFVPVVGADNECIGKLTALRLVGVLRRVVGGCRDDASIGQADKDLLAGTVSPLVDRGHTTFRADATVRDVQREISRTNEGGFIIQDEAGRLQGVITRVNFITQNRLRVVMVDHNEVGQAVDGIEEAEVVEIIDHHRLGARTTTLPITFINRVVGSTCSIVADLYRTAGAVPSARDAGLMLSAMLSDTLVLRSPTTTQLDREIAGWLAGLSAVDIEAYGEEMFAAGASLEGMDPRKLISRDQKIYTEGERTFSLSQVETVGFAPLLAMKNSLRDELARVIEVEKCSFACLMVTDITRESSLLLYEGETLVAGAIAYPRREEWIFEMKDVLSRKKQLLPYFIDLLKGL